MYAIRVVLRPGANAPGGGPPVRDPLGPRPRLDPQPGVEHVSLVAVPPDVVAMTFVVADSLLSAEALAVSAWGVWLTGTRLAGWRLVSCEADLRLGVAAVSEPPVRGDEGAPEN